MKIYKVLYQFNKALGEYIYLEYNLEYIKKLSINDYGIKLVKEWGKKSMCLKCSNYL